MAKIKTSINGKPAEWTEEIKAKWEAALANAKLTEGEVVTNCNYFTPRPWRNEYDRGSAEEGFTYTTNYRHVYVGVIARHPIVREPS